MQDDNRSLWRFIPLSDYESPAEPATQTVRNQLSQLMLRLGIRLQDGRDAAFDEPEQELQSISSSLIERAAPEPDWRGNHIQALTTAYQSWLDADVPGAGLHVLVNAPHSELPQSVRHWAADNGCRVIEPPTTKQLLEMDDDWLVQLKAVGGSRWVLPWLERCYLRHWAGFRLLRGWLDWATEHQAGLIVCDSWAWAFLCRTLQIDQVLPKPHALAPFGAGELKGWLQHPAHKHDSAGHVFRQADSGAPIIGQDDDDTGPEGNGAGSARGQEESDFLQHLAARSRGIPEIAWRVWRHSLLVEGDAEVDGAAEEQAGKDGGRTIWVRAWDQLELPAVPGDVGPTDALVLHALLLHNGLVDELFSPLLPLMPFEVAGALQRLQEAGLVAGSDGCRQVSALGYLAARDFLRQEGFLTDGL